MRHPRGAPTLLMRCLLTGHPDGGPLLHSLGAAGGPTVTILASSTLPPMCIGVMPPVGAGLVAEESKVTPNSEDLPSGCTACWYSVAGQPLGNGGGWWMGGAI